MNKHFLYVVFLYVFVNNSDLMSFWFAAFYVFPSRQKGFINRTPEYKSFNLKGIPL